MLNLSEAWKAGYAAYLEEESKSIDRELDSILSELAESQEETTRGFNLIQEYFSLFSAQEILQEWKPGEAIRVDTSREDEEENTRNSSESNGNSNRTAYGGFKSGSDGTVVNKDLFAQLIQLTSSGADDKGMKYEPAMTYTVQKFSDMKFPENLIFFVSQIIKWIRNVILYFIERFKNLIRRFVGADPLPLNSAALDFNLKRAKKITQVSSSVDLGKGQKGIVSGWLLDPTKENMELLEGLDYSWNMGDQKNLTLAQKAGITPVVTQKPEVKNVVVTIDLSKDINTLRELINHFFKLYDNAYGSNNEQLFGTDDLENILNMFNDTIVRMQNGKENRISIGSNAIEVSGISSDKVKSNLILTNANIENLKAAYVKVSAKIKDIGRIINSKEMLMLTQLGVSYKLLSASTYEQLKRIYAVLPTRYKDIKKDEKRLLKMESQYQLLVKELQKMQTSLNAVSNISFNTIYNRKVTELLNAANWMSQIVTIRLAALGVYIKELKDIKDVLDMLTADAKPKNY